MKCFLYASLLLLTFSCQRLERDTVSPEYSNWYTIKAPIDEKILGVWGDRDKTLLISTFTGVFRSTDQGRNWQKVDQPTASVTGFYTYRDTLFSLDGLLWRPDQQKLSNPSKYSLDDGLTWTLYRRYNPFFDGRSDSNSNTMLLNTNLVRAANDTVYSINRVYLDPPSNLTRRYETPGIITSTGRRIDLPQLHQIQGLYFDSKQRVYIAATDAVCGRGHSGESFSFCNSKGGRGVVYISKRPLP